MKYKLLRFSLLSLLVMLSGVWGSSGALAADKWVKTAPSELSSGDVVAIVDLTSETVMSQKLGSKKQPTAADINLADDKSEILLSSYESGDLPTYLQWVVTVDETPATSYAAAQTTYKFATAEATGTTASYLYCLADNNGVRVGIGDAVSFTIQQDASGVDFLYNTGQGRYLGVYNGQDWRCYTSINANIRAGQTAFYKKVSADEEKEGYVYRDFAVQLTNADVFDTSNMNFGVKIDANGGYSAISADDESANFTVNAVRFNDSQHGWVNCTFTIPVQGPVKIGLSNCQYGAQSGTITDSEGNKTDLTVGNSNCWTPNDVAGTTSYTYYKGTGPTTLTVVYNGYSSYISVEAVSEDEIPSTVTVTFLKGSETDVLGEAPKAISVDAGKEITIPENRSLYREGYTLQGWDAVVAILEPGATQTVGADMTLTPVWRENTLTLADVEGETEATWQFGEGNGAPTIAIQGANNAKAILVAQAIITKGEQMETIDVKLDIDATNGKFYNKGRNDKWAQLIAGTVLTFPSTKNAQVELETYSDPTGTTLNSSPMEVGGSNGNYYAAGQVASKDDTAEIIIDGTGYGSSLRVIYNEQESNVTEKAIIDTDFQDWTKGNSQTVTTNFSNETIEFTMDAASVDPTATNEGKFPTTTDPAFMGYIMSEKKASTVTTSTFNNITKVRYRHGATGSKRGWGLRYKAEGDTDWTLVSDELTNGNAWIERDINKDNVQLQWYNLNEEQYAYMFELEVYANVEITAEQVTLATTVTPEGAGQVTVSPFAPEYDINTEVTLTAKKNFGYNFKQWVDEDGTPLGTDPTLKYTIEKSTTVTAEFEPVETYALTLTVDGANDYMVTLDPAPTDGKYEAGTKVRLTANQYPELVTFLGWDDQTTNTEKEITIGEDVNVTAHYSMSDIIAGWDFYTVGNNGRKADYSAEENDADALSLVNTATGEVSGWLDKSTVAGGGYESFKGAAVNWRTGEKDGDVGNWHWQTKVNAQSFSDINVQFQMLYNYNAYQTYNVEWSTDGQDWTNAGSITMTGAKNPSSFSEQLPAEADNQQNLYIRLIADKTSKVDGTASKNDGNALAMFFITGTPRIVDDGTAPVLVSTVPEDGATGASATGKVVLTFDERVKLADTFVPTAILSSDNGEQELTPVVSGKTVIFNYKGLEYGTTYSFSLEGGAVADLTDNFIVDPISFSFTTMVRPSVEKKLYDEVVEDIDGLLAALDKAEKRADKSERYRIFIKDGDYTIPLKQTTKTVNGFSVPECITFINSSNISFIGEHRDNVVITNAIDPNEVFNGEYGVASKYDGIGNSDVFQIGSSVSGLYWQDLTISTGMEDARGRDIAIQDKGTKNIYKNTTLHGYQDTWTSNNDFGLYYFEDGIIRGRTDYMCGKGDIYFNRVELQQIAGGYAAVPSKPAKIGWVYKDCVINGDGSGVDGNYTLGRPWGSGTPTALFIDTKMNVVPSAIGWNEMSNGWPARFAEYNSTTASGSQIDLSGRKKVFGDGHANNPVLTAEEAAYYSDMTNMYGDWEPTLATEQAPVPTDVQLKGNELSWTGSDYALLYAICKDGHVVDFTTEETYTVDDTDAAWTIRAANEMGGLCEESEIAQLVADDEEELTDKHDLPTIDGGDGYYYATNYGEYAYKIDGNTEAYIATVVNNELVLSEIVDNIIPEKTAVILKSANNPVSVEPLDEQDGKYTDALNKETADNDLQGQKSEKNPTASRPVFVLGKQGSELGFVKTDTPVNAFTSFVELDAADAPVDGFLPLDRSLTTDGINDGTTAQKTPKFFRTFDKNVASTICLPFEYDPQDAGTLYKFIGVGKGEFNQWTATMQEITSPAEANTPYLFMPDATKTLTYTGTFTPNDAVAGVVNSGDWNLNGTFDDILWDAADGKTYGFSADDVAGIKAGDFVKVGDYTKIRPLRAYMTYVGSGAAPAPARGAANRETLPDRIQVVLLDASGEVTGIGELNTETGNVDKWYDLNGRQLNTKPSQKGIYIKNGTKVTVK